MPKPPRFGLALKRFLRSKAPRECFPGLEWLDGGCLVLADALVRWSEGALQPGGVLRRVSDRAVLDHAFAWRQTAQGIWLLDGDGIQDEVEMRRKLTAGDRNWPITFRYSESYRFGVGVVRSRRGAQTLSQLLEQRFGRFGPSLLEA